jgi:hypothetical protein
MTELEEGQTLHKPKRKRLRNLILFLGLLLLLENVPGTYTLKDAQDEFDLDSWEGIALLALSSVDLNAELYFEGQTLHRISRNAEILAPAGTTLMARASMVPLVEENEVVARPQTALLTADKPLTFIYRGVTVARAKTLRMKVGDPQHRIEAVGRYRVISALFTSYRYHRQKKVRRDYQEPTRAKLNLTAEIAPHHQISFLKEYHVATGSEPGTLSIENAHYDRGNWTAGQVNLTASLSNPEVWLAPMLSTLIPNRFELGRIFEVELRKLHNIRFSDNALDLYIDGALTSANSQRVENVLQPSFQANLGIAFDLPSHILLHEAEAEVSVKKIRNIDFNNSNPIFDNSIRSIARNYREKAKARVNLGEEFPELLELPVRIFVHHLRISGAEDGGPVVTLSAEIR